MEQFDLSNGIKKYLKESQFVIPVMSLSIVVTFICFAVVILFWILTMDLTTPLILLCIFAIISVVLYLRYKKNSRHYYFFGYVDAFPDMDAPLNVLAMENYYDRLVLRAMDYGFSEIETVFEKTRQIYHLDLRAKAPNGNLVSVSFETQSFCFYDLTRGVSKTQEYKEFLTKDKDVINGCFEQICLLTNTQIEMDD